MSNASEGTLLIVLTTSEARLGLVFLDMKKTVDQIQKIM